MKKIIILLFLFLLSILPVQAQDYVIFLPVIVKMTTENNWQIIQPVASSNLVLNPSAETTANFSAVNGATVTRVTTFQKYGLYSYRVQSVASGDGIQLTTTTAANVEHFSTVRVRKPYPTGLQASLNGNARTLVLIEKIDANWDLLGIDFPAAMANGATSVQILATASGDFYVDGVQVEPLNYPTTYIDGTQAGCAWLGPAHAAASERSGQSRAGGRSLDFFDEYGFRIHKIVGAGASPHILSIDPYAVLPGGELNSDKVESRNFEIVGEFIADTEQELHEKRQELEAAFQTDDNQLTLIRFNGAAVQKEIAVRYSSGLESDLPAFYDNITISTNESTKKRLFSEEASIQVAAPDPRWFEVGESAVDLDTNDSATFRHVAGRLKSTGQWDELGPPNVAGTYTWVFTIAEDDTYIYFGGNFTNFDNIANADYIVRWHKIDQVYSALGTGMDNVVYDLKVGPDGTLYAIGEFLNAGGGGANRIASWDGAAWSALGTGLNAGGISALIIGLDGTLYAGGNFTLAGGVANTAYIAAWDGAAWSALGTGMNNQVESLAVGLDGLIYAGGLFTTAGGGAAAYVASWDPVNSTWSALAGGLASDVRSLAIGLDGRLYAGGDFTTGAGAPFDYIAVWNGTAWNGLNNGIIDAIVYTVVVGADGVVYVGGNFQSNLDTGPLSDGVARWNGSVWSHLDIDLPGASPKVFGVFASLFADPVVNQNYDLYLGFDTTGIGTFAGAVIADNEGSVQAFPKIVYARSGGTTATIETLRNETTGKELLFNYSLLAGETLVIDLDPLQKTIESSFFGSRLDAVLPNSDFGIWSLPRGNSNVTSYINESGTPTLVSYMQWRDAFSGYD